MRSEAVHVAVHVAELARGKRDRSVNQLAGSVTANQCKGRV